MRVVQNEVLQRCVIPAKAGIQGPGHARAESGMPGLRGHDAFGAVQRRRHVHPYNAGSRIVQGGCPTSARLFRNQPYGNVGTFLRPARRSRVETSCLLASRAVSLAAPLIAQKRHRCDEGSDSRPLAAARRVCPLSSASCLRTIEAPRTTIWARASSLGSRSRRTQRAAAGPASSVEVCKLRSAAPSILADDFLMPRSSGRTPSPRNAAI